MASIAVALGRVVTLANVCAGGEKMKQRHFMLNNLLRAAGAMLAMAVANVATATEPCEDFGECKVLIEINASDGDAGFHFLMDGDDLNSARIRDPDGRKVFEDEAKGPLREQKLTETFAESAEPLCWDDGSGEDFVTLAEFLELWTPGDYTFEGSGDDGEKSEGETELTFALPAAPADVDFDDDEISGSYGTISWGFGDDLGNCADGAAAIAALDNEFEEFSLLTVPVAPGGGDGIEAWEVVLEPDVCDDDPFGALKFTVRLPGNISSLEVAVPAEYLASLPPNTLVKTEVGAIGGEDNATFSEEGDFCVNGDACEECEEE